MGKIIIAIDGYSGCGKSSTAKAVARQLGYTYVDSGAMYRAVTLYFLDKAIDLNDPAAIEQALGNIEINFQLGQDGNSETFLNGKVVEKEIREMKISQHVSKVSAIPAVRRAMVRQQQSMGLRRGIVMDGRDIGTVVFPDAELKIFLSADLRVRAERRLAELNQKGSAAQLEEIIENLSERDLADSSRADSPLFMAPGAIEIDTSNLTFGEQVQRVTDLAKKLF
ncbi:MAG: (d)CMP kinase [Cyclobacteriaceae bacterium]